MVDVFVDPQVFGWVSPATSSGIRSFVDRLRALREMSTSGCFRVSKAESAGSALYQSGQYPVRQSVQADLTSAGVSEFQAKDIVAIVDALLKRIPASESAYGLQDVLFEKCDLQPASILSGRDLHMCEALFRTAQLMDSIERKFKMRGYLLVNSAIHTRLDLSGELIMTDPADFDPGVPRSVSSQLAVIDTTRLGYGISAEVLWSSGNEECMLLAISTRLASRFQPPHRKWSIGAEFFASVKSLGADSENRATNVLESITDTIARSNLRATHELRINSGGNSPARMRGHDVAWRRDVDHELHLHYWETVDGPELACLSPHNRFDIP